MKRTSFVNLFLGIAIFSSFISNEVFASNSLLSYPRRTLTKQDSMQQLRDKAAKLSETYTLGLSAQPTLSTGLRSEFHFESSAERPSILMENEPFSFRTTFQEKDEGGEILKKGVQSAFSRLNEINISDQNGNITHIISEQNFSKKKRSSYVIYKGSNLKSKQKIGRIVRKTTNAHGVEFFFFDVQVPATEKLVAYMNLVTQDSYKKTPANDGSLAFDTNHRETLFEEFSEFWEVHAAPDITEDSEINHSMIRLVASFYHQNLKNQKTRLNTTMLAGAGLIAGAAVVGYVAGDHLLAELPYHYLENASKYLVSAGINLVWKSIFYTSSGAVQGVTTSIVHAPLQTTALIAGGLGVGATTSMGQKMKSIITLTVLPAVSVTTTAVTGMWSWYHSLHSTKTSP